MTGSVQHAAAGGSSPTGELPARRGRRPLVALAVTAAVVLGVLAGGSAVPARAAWSSTTQTGTSLTMATWGSAFTLSSGAGTVSNAGAKYSVTAVLGSGTGYVDLVNTGTVPATLSLTVTVGSVVGASPASVCSQAWNAGTGACPGTTTMIGLSLVLGQSTGTYTAPAPLAPGGRVYLKVAAGGVAGGATLTTNPVAVRAPMDRSSS